MLSIENSIVINFLLSEIGKAMRILKSTVSIVWLIMLIMKKWLYIQAEWVGVGCDLLLVSDYV